MGSIEKQDPSGCLDAVPKSDAERRDKAVEYIGQFSVQLVLPEQQSLVPFGSGVLVELDGHYFILTAGHCIDNIRYKTIQLKGSNARPPFEAHIKEPRGVWADKDLVEDYGFYELGPKGVEAAHDNGNRFLDRNGLCVLDEKISLEAWACGIVSGFPLNRTLVIEQDITSRFLALSMNPDLASYSPGKYRKCIMIDLTQMVPDGLSADLRGASGGGFWILKREDFDNPLNLKLAGINVGTPNGDGTGSGQEMIVTLVGHHLRWIADEVDGLERFIFDTWHFLKNDAWNTVRRS